MSNAEETATHPHETFLVVDCGHTHTTAVLFDMVDGVYRFVARGSAPTTLGPPWSDVIRGVQHAIGQITETTGRLLLNQQGVLISPTRADGAGVDYFGASASVADPLKTIVVGLLDEVSLASARRALSTIYAQEVDHFSLGDARSLQGQVDAIVQKQPDLIFLAGGTDGSPNQRVLRLVESVGLGIGMLDGVKKPQVIFAGNSNMRPKVSETLGGLTGVHVAANVRPSLEAEHLYDAMRVVGDLYEEIKVSNVPGMEELAGWSSFPIVPTARAFASMVEYFATLYQGRVLGIDVGSDSVTFVAARPNSLRLSVRTDLGLGRPLLGLLDQLDPAVISQWSPSATQPAQLRDMLYHKALHPQLIPLTEEDLHLEQALVRELVRRTVQDAAASWGWSRGVPPFKILLARGNALTNVSRLGQTLLMLLDALQPTGIFAVAVDRYGVLPALGVLAPHEPQVVVQALEGGVLVDVGWVIVPTGRGTPGQTIMQVNMEPGPDLGAEYGKIEVLSLAPGQSAELSVQPSRRFDIGLGPGKGQKMRIHGGAVGVVIDSRGRPIQLPKEEAARRSVVRQWSWELGG
jgi:hypothetical protein